MFFRASLILFLIISFQLNAKSLKDINNFRILVENVVSNSENKCGLSEDLIEIEIKYFVNSYPDVKTVNSGDDILYFQSSIIETSLGCIGTFSISVRAYAFDEGDDVIILYFDEMMTLTGTSDEFAKHFLSGVTDKIKMLLVKRLED